MIPRLRLIAAAAALALPAPAAAAPGDVVEVTSERVNLRAGPSTQTDVVGQASAGDRLVERRREGAWIEARAEAGGATPVWIHASLVRPVPGAKAAPPAARPSTGGGGASLVRFRSAIDGLNQQSRQAGGVAYYESVEETEPGTVRIKVGKAWESVPAANRKSSLDTLADLWRLFVPAGRAAKVTIQNAEGQEIDRRERP